MFQFMTDCLDQLDLAIDQLAIRDRNYDRFAFMLIDNVVELVLHNYADDRAYFAGNRFDMGSPPNLDKTIEKARGQNFDAKAKLAKMSGLVTEELGNSLIYLHQIRNTAYHRGLHHERIMHSLALFYLECACEILQKYSPPYWSYGSDDNISYRARKYLDTSQKFSMSDGFVKAWKTLLDISRSMRSKLVFDLARDMKSTIDKTDESLAFLVDNSDLETRKEVLARCQSLSCSDVDSIKAYAQAHGYDPARHHIVEWLSNNYKWPVTDDPIPSWRSRYKSLKAEGNKHTALKKYSDFMKQTEEIREMIGEQAGRLDAHIQFLVEQARGK